jgi:membrane-associated phospholipid phosphatase
MFGFIDQHIDEGMNNANEYNGTNDANDVNDAIFNYRAKDITSINSPAPIEEGSTGGMHGGENDLIEFAVVEEDHKNMNSRSSESNRSSGRLIENGKNKNEIDIKDAELKNEKKENNFEQMQNLPFSTYFMTWVSFSVTTIIYFIIGMFIYTRNKKWVYILISVILIETFARLVKIISMKYDYEFIMRPGKCIYNPYENIFTLYNNVLLKSMIKEEDKEKYSKRGFPSIHITKSISFITLTYLFFPNYRKILRKVGPIYILLTIYSRMYLNCHTLLQTLAGIVTGFGGSYVLYNLIHKIMRIK